MKEGARLRDIAWSGKRLSFTLESARDAGVGITFMVPASYSGKTLKGITQDGKRAEYIFRTIKSRDYALVTVTGGNNHRIMAHYE